MKPVVNWQKKIAKRYREEGLGMKTIIAGAAAALTLCFASSSATISQLFGVQWPSYIPQAPFQIFSTIAGIALLYETFHLYRE